MYNDNVLPSRQLDESLRAKRAAKECCMLKASGANNDALTKLLRIVQIKKVLPFGLRMCGVHRHARSEIFNFHTRHFEWEFPGLPASFDGLSILHLSDLHADIDPAFPRKLAAALSGVFADYCVMTGDFQDDPDEPHHGAVEAMKTICNAISVPIFAVPGNHDKLPLLDALHQLGIRFLLNNAFEIEGAGFHICGIDDPHYYQTHNLNKVDGCGFRLLLSHSPETYREAAGGRFAMMLSGHTHAGQFRVPGFGHIIKRAAVPRPMVWGVWRHKDLFGYTSSGTGATGVPARLFCRPEIIVHCFRKSALSAAPRVREINPAS